MAAQKKTRPVQQASITAFTRALDKAYGSWGYLIARSFVSGIFIGLGATVGFALVIVIVGYVFSALGVLPIVGDFFIRLNEFINSTTPAVSNLLD